MHAKCLIAEPMAKKEKNICCNHVVKPGFVPIVSSTSKNKLLYIPPHKRNHKVERNVLQPKPFFRSHPRDLSGSKFVLTCYHYGVIGHIRPQCSMLNREQNHIPKSLPKKPSGRDFVTIVVHLVILDLITLSFKFLKEKKNLSFLEVVFCKLNRI